MSHAGDTDDVADEPERELTLDEVEEALADESHPLRGLAERENAKIASNLSGSYLDMLRRTDAAAAAAMDGVGEAAMEAIRKIRVDLPRFEEPTLENIANRLPPGFDWSVTPPDLEPYVDPTPSKLDEMIEVGRAQHEAMARILLAADTSAEAAKQSAEDGKRYGRRSLIAAWVGIGVAVLIGAGSIVVAVVLNG